MPTDRFEIERRDHFSKFEKYGESEVRVQIDRWEESSKTRYRYAQEWLRLKEEERALAASSKRDAREEETLSVAKEANSLACRAISVAEEQAFAARRSARYAMYMAIIAAISAIIAAKEDIILLFLTRYG